MYGNHIVAAERFNLCREIGCVFLPRRRGEGIVVCRSVQHRVRDAVNGSIFIDYLIDREHVRINNNLYRALICSIRQFAVDGCFISSKTDRAISADLRSILTSTNSRDDRIAVAAKRIQQATDGSGVRNLANLTYGDGSRVRASNNPETNTLAIIIISTVTT